MLVSFAHSVICAKIGVVGDMDRTCSQFHQYLYLSITPPPLCMQRRRYSFCGIYAAALLKHPVVGWCLHHAEDEGVGGVSHWYYCFAASVFVLPCKLSYLYPSVGGRRTHSSNMRSYPLLPFREIPCRMVLQSPPYREDIRCS